jgi:hypothetical protein
MKARLYFPFPHRNKGDYTIIEAAQEQHITRKCRCYSLVASRTSAGDHLLCKHVLHQLMPVPAKTAAPTKTSGQLVSLVLRW